MPREALRKLARTARNMTGWTEKQLLTPYYWIPYHLNSDGKAWKPLFVTIELTYLCNLKCQMCSLVVGEMTTMAGQRKNPELIQPDGGLRREVSTEEYLDVIGQMGRAGVRAVNFTGGEPALRKDILTLCEAVKKQGMHLGMLSNGSAKPEMYRELIRLGLNSISISVDGTHDVHDLVRGVNGSFDKTQVAIRTILEEKQRLGVKEPRLAVTCTISALNQHDLEGVVTLFENSQIDELDFGFLHFSTADRERLTEKQLEGPVMHLKNAKLPDPIVDVNVEDLIRRVEKIRAEREKNRVPVKFNPELNPEEIKLQYTDEWFTYSKKCFYAWYATRIDPWGQMYPCWIDVRLGDVREHGFEKIWNGESYKQFRRLIRKEKILPKCTTCCVLNDKWWTKVPTFRN